MDALLASFDGISKQLGALRKEIKSDLQTFKDGITAQLEDKWGAFGVGINPKFNKINTKIEEQNSEIENALARTEEVEQWSVKVKHYMSYWMKEEL